MELEEINSTECPKCGAPLKRKDDLLTCEYCGHIYAIPEELRDQKREADSYVETHRINISINSERPPIAATPDRPIPVKGVKLTKKQILLIVIFNIIFWPGCFQYIMKSNKEEKRLSETNPEAAFIQRVYKDQYQSEEYPADVEFTPSLSIAVVLSDVTSVASQFEIIIENNLDRAIERDLKKDHLEVDTLSVSDNLDSQYPCRYESKNTYSSMIVPGDILHSGDIKCRKSLAPEVENIQIDMNMPNWGQFHFDIPTRFNPDDLQVDYRLTLNKNSRFNIKLDFHSSPPQLVSFYKKDISIYDNMDRLYSTDKCTAAFIGRGDNQYFTQLVTRSPYNSGNITCYFFEPLPLDVNELSVNLSTQGKTTSATTEIDKIDGTIDFSNHPDIMNYE